MYKIKNSVVMCCLLMLLGGCSVMSANLRDRVNHAGDFEDLVGHMDKAQGATVILGGYVIEVTNKDEKSTLLLLQAPLDLQDLPGSPDKSKGRLIVDYPGFMDPEVYSKNRKVTIGGRIVDGAARAGDETPYPFLRIAAEEVYLWPAQKDCDCSRCVWGYPHPLFYRVYWRYP